VQVLVDAHVHVHPRADAAALLDAALANFTAEARDARASTWRGVLMLAEMRERDWFGDTYGAGGAGDGGDSGGAGGARRARGAGAQLGRWRVAPAVDAPAVLHAARSGGSAEDTLTLFAGRQAVTTEGIEVLALAARLAIDDGASLGETLRRAAAAAALTVLPWGAGKWLGARGRRVERALTAQAPPVFAGDNGGRPSIWAEPRAFGIAQARGRGLVSGSDPLPLPGEERRVGSFGFRIALPKALAEAPFVARPTLVSTIERAAPQALVPFGRRDGGAQFLRRQLALRFSARRAASQSAMERQQGAATAMHDDTRSTGANTRP
jgi:hypothetical protein